MFMGISTHKFKLENTNMNWQFYIYVSKICKNKSCL